MEVYVVTQIRQYSPRVSRPFEIECLTEHEANRLRGPYTVNNPKRGFIYSVVDSSVEKREVDKITKPVDDFPEEEP
jgi:hypothetical protein